MPNGIFIINQMPYPIFHDVVTLTHLIDSYFKTIEGEYHLENTPAKNGKEKEPVTQQIWDRGPEPATFSGLALFLGFTSLDEFDDYIENGEYGETVKKARLQVEASYEKKIHTQSATGIIFVLKTMGWKERPENKEINAGEEPQVIKIEIVESGPPPAGSEKEVVL